MEKKQQDNSVHSADNSQKKQIKRRTLLKALVGIPVLGAFGFGSRAVEHANGLGYMRRFLLPTSI